ncbi:serine hydrolase [Streptomyces nigra]|uniref:serine hydrolase n=1 Tax=Streptomyces nigra TaxID=1827580 RepID=UPI003685261C
MPTGVRRCASRSGCATGGPSGLLVLRPWAEGFCRCRGFARPLFAKGLVYLVRPPREDLSHVLSSRSPVATCVLGGSQEEPVVSGGHDPDRYAEMGSFTKVVTATVLQRLAEQGVVGFDDPAERWLGVPAGTGITLRHLAGHTSGRATGPGSAAGGPGSSTSSRTSVPAPGTS